MASVLQNMKTMRGIGTIFLNLYFGLWLLLFSMFAQAAESPRVLLISVDGLSPQFYLDPGIQAPTLKKMVAQGARAFSVFPVFPSLTYPNHATLVTGALPKVHGILANRVFSERSGPTDQWYFEASHFRVKPLWQLAREAGRKVAIVRWPSSVGAEVDWLIPEIFDPHAHDLKKDWERVSPLATPGLLAEIREAGISDPGSLEQLDEFSVGAAIHLLRDKKPDLTLVHLVGLDFVQHRTGRDSEATRKELLKVDGLVARLLESVDLKETAVFVVGDHGMKNYRGVIHINQILAQKGWLTVHKGKIRDWQVVAHAEGGQAAIYAKDPVVGLKALRYLDNHTNGRFQVLNRKLLDKHGAYPGAIAGLEAVEGVIFDEQLNGQIASSGNAVRGAHGYLPWDSEVRTGFLAMGAGVQSGREFSVIDITDVAVTIAHHLGLSFPHPVAGKKLNLTSVGRSLQD